MGWERRREENISRYSNVKRKIVGLGKEGGKY